VYESALVQRLRGLGSKKTSSALRRRWSLSPQPGFLSRPDRRPGLDQRPMADYRLFYRQGGKPHLHHM
ncbi:uncharacterized protein METZ01_LOCUS483651, partial [marine metagenome]